MPVVCIVARNGALEERVREAARDLNSVEWRFIQCAPDLDLPEADAYIWELEGVRSIRSEWLARSLFVIDENLRGRLRRLLGERRANIAFHPAEAAAIRPFLRQLIPLELSVPKTETQQMLDTLLQSNLKLQGHDEQRTNFLARVVHDLRAPLTALAGYSSLLMDQRFGPLNSVQLEMLRNMHLSATRVSQLTDAIYDLSAGRPGKEPVIEEADVEQTIEHAVHEIALRVEEKQIRIGVSVDFPETELMFDRAQIERVLVNLLENACKFTPRKGSIEVCGYAVLWDGSSRVTTVSDPRANAYRIDVRDSGPGIPIERIEAIFDEYVCYGGGSDRSGGGLGLAICRMILAGHGGIIWAESSGRGAQFSFILPNGTQRKPALGPSARKATAASA